MAPIPSREKTDKDTLIEDIQNAQAGHEQIDSLKNAVLFLLGYREKPDDEKGSIEVTSENLKGSKPVA